MKFLLGADTFSNFVFTATQRRAAGAVCVRKLRPNLQGKIGHNLVTTSTVLFWAFVIGQYFFFFYAFRVH